MDQLVTKMNVLLASSFVLYLKSHKFHWNVEGQDFHQYHGFLGSFYESVFGSVDTTAEQIRALNYKAKGSLTEFKEDSAIADQVTNVSIQEMLNILHRDNETLIGVMMDVHEEATKQRQFGLINYIEGLIDTHRKHGWMLRASMEPIKPGAANEEQATTYEITFNK